MNNTGRKNLSVRPDASTLYITIYMLILQNDKLHYFLYEEKENASKN